MGSPFYWVQANTLADHFPDPAQALTDPDGLLAVGGDLSPETLIVAYRHGIFPWFSDGQPILWWAPDPRSIMVPGCMKISRSLRKVVRNGDLMVTVDQAFDRVIKGCAAPRGNGHTGTWITDDMSNAYNTLHKHGYAHSVETWYDDQLVGGLYGVAIGRVFFGESMFSAISNASKVAMVHLNERLDDWGYRLIDCQIHNPHLETLGAETIPRSEFNDLVTELSALAPSDQAWRAGQRS